MTGIRVSSSDNGIMLRLVSKQLKLRDSQRQQHANIVIPFPSTITQPQPKTWVVPSRVYQDGVQHHRPRQMQKVPRQLARSGMDHQEETQHSQCPQYKTTVFRQLKAHNWVYLQTSLWSLSVATHSSL